jgi:hypothetical protein
MISKIILGFVFLTCITHLCHAQLPAFPGAEGFGALATGGRGGTVVHVTSLNDVGPGTFREAVSAPGRTVVFDVSGVIKITDRIQVASNITIAGQSAPGEGVVIYGNGLSFSHEKNIIVRYLRMRGSIDMPRGKCVLTADSADNMIFDHVSVQWGRWDNLHIKHSSNITLQYCLIGESIDPQRFGALLEHPKRLTIHHCLWIDNQSRNPKAKADIEYINNVIYNWGASGFVGGHSAEHHHQDIVNNYFIAGPNSTDSFLSMFTKTDHVFHSGNYADLNKDGVLNGRLIANSDFVNKGADLVKQRQNIPSVPVTIENASTAFSKVMKTAGVANQRDAVDRRLIDYLKTLGTTGKIFKTETDAGGQPEMANNKTSPDDDGDGIPNEWEKANKLNPANAKDDAAKVTGGYTWLEVYLNSLVK